MGPTAKEMTRAGDILSVCEGSNDLIIVDVQPQYSKHIGFNVYNLMEYANSKGRVLVFFVGDKTVGQDTEDDVRFWMYEHGLEEDTNTTFVDKGYAFLRGLMDNGVDFETITSVLGDMLDQGVQDSRDLDEMPELYTDEPIFIPHEINGDLLRSFNGAEICGGGRHECLAEIQILMDAMGLNYTTLGKFVY